MQFFLLEFHSFFLWIYLVWEMKIKNLKQNSKIFPKNICKMNISLICGNITFIANSFLNMRYDFIKTCNLLLTLNIWVLNIRHCIWSQKRKRANVVLVLQIFVIFMIKKIFINKIRWNEANKDIHKSYALHNWILHLK